MSWWETGHNDDIIGDVPADIVGDTLKIIAHDCKVRGLQKPSLQEILCAIVAAINTSPEKFLEDMEGKSIRKITAKLNREPFQVSCEESDNKRNKFSKFFTDAFDKLVNEYTDAWNRKPRLRELLECFLFVLGYRPEDFLSISEGVAIEEIFAEIN